MRQVTRRMALWLSVFGFSAALVSGQESSEGDAIMAINRAHAAEFAFVAAWNEWAKGHDPLTTNVEDKARFKKVRTSWKDFDRLCRAIDY